MNLHWKPLVPKVEVIQDVNFILYSLITKRWLLVSDFKYLQKSSKSKTQYNAGNYKQNFGLLFFFA